MRLPALLLLSFFCTLGICLPAQAEGKRCEVTPAIKPVDKYPGREAVVPSNKLALPAGKSAYPPGELVYLSGRVLDENCVPVSDAVIDIWQTDPRGNYVKSSLAQRMSPYPDFTGSGRAVTDNLGYYNFVTLFPGPTDKRAPNIHFRIIHKSFATLDTEMFFLKDWRNAKDPKFSKLNAAQSALLLATVKVDSASKEEALKSTWQITLRGANPYRKY